MAATHRPGGPGDEPSVIIDETPGRTPASSPSTVEVDPDYIGHDGETVIFRAGPNAAAEAAAAIATQAARPREHLAKLRELSNLRSKERPRPGKYSYLLVDLESLESTLQASDTKTSALLAEAKLFQNAQAREYHVSTFRGYLVIINTSERAANSLLASAESIRQNVPEAKIFLGQSTLSYPDEKSFDLGPGFPNGDMQKQWRNYDHETYLTKILAEKLQDPNSREGSLCDVELTETTDPNIYILENYTPKPKLRVGGPDRLIGYGDKLFELSGYLRDDDTKLIFVKGEAGIGKSRILSHAAEDLPNAIITSLDASDKNVHGAGLVTLARQLALLIAEDKLLQDDQPPQPATENTVSLTRFSELARPAQIEYALSNPDQLAQHCLGALRTLNFTRAQKLPFILEDLHHADEFSAKHLLAIANEYIETTEGKVVISMRPEEMHQSEEQNKLKAQIESFYGEESVGTVSLEGLNFQNEEISYDFVFYSLPEAVRTGRELGTWHRDLGKAAGNSPFKMKTFMDAILSDPENLEIRGNTIYVKPSVLDRIQKVSSSSDFGEFIQERIEKLSTEAKQILQSIALAGGKLTADQIQGVIEAILGTSVASERMLTIYSELLNNGYIVKNPADDSFQFQHESMTEFAANSFTDPAEKRMIASFLLTRFAHDKTVHPDVHFSLMLHFGESEPEDNERYWQSLGQAASAAFANAREHNAIGKSHAIARRLYDPINQGGLAKIHETIQALKTVDLEGLSDSTVRLAVETLMNLAESAIYLGRNEDSAAALDTLKNIVYALQTFNLPEEVISNKRLTKLVYEKAYIVNVPQIMEDVYEKEIKDSAEFSDEEKAVALIKLQYRKRNYQGAIATFEQHREALEAVNKRHQDANKGRPHPEFVEAFRVAKTRAPLEMIDKSIKNLGHGIRLDDDITLQPGAIDPTRPEQAAQLAKIYQALMVFEGWEESFPTMLYPYAKMTTEEVRGRLHSLLGDTKESITRLKEAWRLANKMDLHSEAARYAKMLGDRHVDRFFLGQPNSQGTTLKHQSSDLLKAIEIYGKEGTASLSQMEDPKNFYHVAMRIQKARALALLLENADLDGYERIPQALKSELEPMIQEALFEDLAFINQRYSAAISNLEKHSRESYNATFKNRDYDADKAYMEEIAYYYTSYVGLLLEFAKKLDITVPNEIFDAEASPFTSPDMIGGALELSAHFEDKNMGELSNRGEAARKRDGLIYIFRETLSRRTERTLQIEKDTKQRRRIEDGEETTR